jgi:hypothetical protein
VTQLVHWVFVVLRAVAVAPFDTMPPGQALEHGLAMVAASSPEISEQEIRRITEHESGYDVDARPGMRSWPDDPAAFPPRCRTLRSGRRQCGFVCGLMQASAATAEQCVAWQHDVYLAYQAGADQMRSWHATCRRLGRRGSARYACARAGYALGTEAARLAGGPDA